MSDAKLRDLERRWRETGTIGDEADYLVERVRLGHLSNERLRLAAYLGHEGARVSLRNNLEAGLEPHDWTDAVCSLSREIAVRLALVAARWALSTYEASDERDEDGEIAAEVQHAIDIAESWLSTGEPQQFRFRFRQGAWLPPAVVRAVVIAGSSLGRCVDPSWHSSAPAEEWAARGVQALLGAPPDRFATEPIRSSFAGVASFDQIKTLLAEELLPWALASEPR